MKSPNIGLEIEDPQEAVDQEYGEGDKRNEKISSSYHTNSNVPETKNSIRFKSILVMVFCMAMFIYSTSSQIISFERNGLDHTVAKNFHENTYGSLKRNNESMATNLYEKDNILEKENPLAAQSGQKSTAPKYSSFHEQNKNNIQGHYLHDENTSPFSNELYEEYPLGTAEAEQEQYLEKMKEVREKYGAWDFRDDFEGIRPIVNTFNDYPNRDVPSSTFPPNSWQTDKVYVEKLIDESLKLVRRVRTGIYEEYGYGSKPYTEEELKDIVGINFVDPPNYPLKHGRTGHYKIGNEIYENGIAWMTKSGFDALARKLLHAMITNDEFYVVLAGHSAAAGHGNQFFQTKSMQFQYLMEPVFDKLGMTLVTRNMAMGGLGTLQTALGGDKIYGERDFLIWDSAMTEKGNDVLDVFNRQALLSGQRLPIIMIGGQEVGSHGNLRKILEDATGGWWHGDFHEPSSFIHFSDEYQELNDIPYAAQGLKCDHDWERCGNENKFASRCWINRKDIIPPMEQQEHPGSQVKWHPGWRHHRWESRKWALVMLQALEKALFEWSEKTSVDGHPLADENWHIGDRYDKIREAVKSSSKIDENEPTCESHVFSFIPRICTLSLSAATEFTPRADPEQSSIRKLLVPAPNGYVPHEDPDNKNLYYGPDLLTPELKVPEGEADAHAIAIVTTYDSDQSRGRKLAEKQEKVIMTSNVENTQKSFRRNLSSIVPGQGWSLSYVRSGFCDGTAQSECSRDKDQRCLLYGHNDGHGVIMGDGFSGWLVMQLPGVKEGLVMVRMETWRNPGENQRTEGWTEENNGKTHETTSSQDMEENENVDIDDVEDEMIDDSSGKNRRLKGEPAPLPDGFCFEIAINGEIKASWDKDQLEEQRHNVAYNLDMFILLDDPSMKDRFKSENEEGETVEVAIRMSGVGRDATYALSHVYWA